MCERNYIEPWIGSIPETWKLVRGKFLFQSEKEINTGLKCQNLLSLTLNGVLNKDFNSSDGLRPATYETYQIFQKDDLVFKMIDLENVRTSRVGIVHEEGIMSPVYIRQRPEIQKIYPRFGYWFYFDLYQKAVYNSIGSGVRASLSSSDILELKLPVPPINEQKVIAAFIDKKINQIDALVSNIEKKIELLKEYRIALINQYVTKGLNPKAKMKDSEVEWLGQIPKHWNKSRIKYLFSEYFGGSWGDDIIDDNDKNIVSVIRVSDFNLARLSIKYTIPTYRSLEINNKSHKLVRKDDLIIEKSGGGKNSPVGKVVQIVNTPKNKTINSNFTNILRPNLSLVLPRFAAFLLHAYYHAGITAKNIKQTTGIQNLDISSFMSEICFIPDKIEQQEIIASLESLNTQVLDLIDANKKKIQLFKEYRESLISNVVTGKVRITKDML